MHYLLASGMKKITTSIFILLFWLKISTASEFERQSKVGHLIKSGKLFLLHSNKTQKDRDTERDDYQLHSTAGRNITPIIYRTHSAGLGRLSSRLFWFLLQCCNCNKSICSFLIISSDHYKNASYAWSYYGFSAVPHQILWNCTTRKGRQRVLLRQCALPPRASQDFSCKVSGIGKMYNQTSLLNVLLCCETSCDFFPLFWICSQVRDIDRVGCFLNESSWCVCSSFPFWKLCDHRFCNEKFHPVPLPSQQPSLHRQKNLLFRGFLVSDLGGNFQGGVFVRFGFPRECQFLSQAAQQLQAPVETNVHCSGYCSW